MKAYRHEGHWDLANSFLVEIIFVHQIFIQHLICSCHFARSTEENVKKKKKVKNSISDFQENIYWRKMQTYTYS